MSWIVLLLQYPPVELTRQSVSLYREHWMEDYR